MNNVHIVRILRVIDTRQFEEQGDRWVAIPGSGNARPCDRCGRDHEIHVDVELSDGTTALIGQGCARGDSMESSVKAAVSTATTLARLRRQLARATDRHAAAAAAWATVAAMPIPASELSEEIPDEYGRSPRQIWRMGDATVWVLGGSTFNAERRACLENSWRNNRYLELAKPAGLERWPDSLRNVIADLTTRIDKAERKAALTVSR